MDPASIALIFGVAKTAFEGIKAGIKVGKDIQGMVSDISKLYGSVAKLTHLSASPPRPPMFSKITAEEMAMDIVVKRKQAEEWFNEVKNEFVGTYGIRGWEEVQKEITRIKKAQKEEAARAAKEAAELKKDLMLLATMIIGVLVVSAVVFFVAILSS